MADKKKLLCVIGQLGNGGSEKQLYLFLKYQTKYELAVFVTGPNEGLWSEKIQKKLNCKIFFTGRTSKLNKILQYRMILKSFAPDIIFSWSFFTNILVYFSGKRDFIGSLRQQFSDENAASWSTRMCLSSRMKQIVVNSLYIKKELIEFGVPDSKVAVVYNVFETGDDGDFFKFQKSFMRRKLFVQYQIPENSIVVMGVGRNSKVKNFSFFIDVIEAAVKINPKIYAVIVGSGGSAFEEEIARRNLDECITLTGEVPYAQKYLFAADIFFLSSLKEGMPNVLIESVYAGCTPFATDVAGVRDVFQFLSKDIVENIIINDFSVDSAAKKLVELISNHKIRSESQRNARKFLDKLTPETVMEEFDKILE
jgi:glycosyltransferase involved in cell wall biosynthesis